MRVYSDGSVLSGFAEDGDIQRVLLVVTTHVVWVLTNLCDATGECMLRQQSTTRSSSNRNWRNILYVSPM